MSCGPNLGNILCLVVAQWLRCCATNRKVTGSIPHGVNGIFHLTQSFRSHYSPGVDSASKRNEYQEDFLEVNAAGAYGWQPYHLPVPLSWILGTLTLILRRSRTGTVWFYTSISNKIAARSKLYTKSLTRDLKLMYSRFTLVRISINL